MTKTDDHSERVAHWVLGVLSTLLFAYAAVRARTVSFSYDEAYTFLHHVRKGMFYQQVYDQMGGNHHLLNVWGMWASMKLFGTSELALRLPNLLAHVIYLYASARIALRARSLALVVVVFVLLNAHPYLIDFFSLARGYGLACGMMMMSLWHSWRFFEDDCSLRRLAVATAFASLAAMSHVIMINYLLAFGLSFLAMGAWRARSTGVRPWRKHLLVLIAIGAVGLAVILPNALGLFHGGSLNFGCDTMWACMVRTLAEKIVYHTPYGEAPLVILGYVLGAVAAWSVLALLIAWRKASERQGPFVFALLTLGACVLSFWMQNVLFGVPLPTTRTALFLLPLCAFVFSSSLITWSGPSLVATITGAVVCLPLMVNQAGAMNNDHSVEWVTTGEVRSALEIVAGDHLPLTAERPQVKISTDLESCGPMAYYILRRNWNWMANTERKPQDSFPRSDYYLVQWDAHHMVDGAARWTKLYHSTSTGLALFRDERVRNMGHRLLHHGRFERAQHPADVLPVLTWVVPPEKAGSMLVITGSVQARELADANWLSLTLEVRRDGKEIEVGGQASHWQVLRYGEWGTASAEFMPRTVLQAGDIIRFSVSHCFLEPVIEIGDADLWVLE